MTPERRARAGELHPVGPVDDFPEGVHKVVRVGGREIGVFNIRGHLYGLPNVCPHQTGPVCAGRGLHGTTGVSSEGGWHVEWEHEGEIISCPWHGMEFHVPTGQCLAWPEVRLRTYQVEVRDDQVVVVV